MRIGFKFFLGALGVFALGAFLGLSYLHDEITPRYREAVEEPLVDFSHTLASILGASELSASNLSEALRSVRDRELQATIFGIRKDRVDLRVTVTNEKGIVLLDSFDPKRVGQDFSNWMDIARTLRGEYGARTTRDNREDPNSTVLYVSAPILRNGEIRGVVTLAKPTRNFNRFIERTEFQLGVRVLLVCGTGLIAVLLLSSFVVTRPIEKLVQYARLVASGKNALLPRLRKDEIGDLAEVFEQMRKTLEGRRFVEEYIQSLTHELKSPLAGIQGALEVLQDSTSGAAISKRFLNNIRTDSERMSKLVDRMLKLSSLEGRNSLANVEDVSLNAVVRTVVSEVREQRPDLQIEVSAEKESVAQGDKLLLEQTVRNLLENAMSFAKSSVRISLRQSGPKTIVEVQDDGPGIPEYALNRIFERFYSLPRPNSDKKSTGLGLCFCREIIRLHGGSLTVVNAPDGGARAEVLL